MEFVLFPPVDESRFARLCDVARPCEDLLSDVMAEHVMGFVLCFARNLHLYLREQQNGERVQDGDQSYVMIFISGPRTMMVLIVAILGRLRRGG
jgi:lactate dehydrogenase-like 2-hydroxyacid dehydrogenase